MDVVTFSFVCLLWNSDEFFILLEISRDTEKCTVYEFKRFLIYN